jgi:ubiquinone/menaquinone biosynthesis C-methylase UbiE
MRAVWHRLIVLGFRLLYNELAWLYDPISWIFSLGRWRRWQNSIWPYLPASGRVLEVGFGPGHLQVDLAKAGYAPIGIDLSPAMHRQARRRLQKLRFDVRLCRARAECLPFASQAFDAVVLTFPTAFVYDPDWLQELKRVLKRSGCAIVVEMASFDRPTPGSRLLEWLYRITGQRGPAPDLVGLLATVGLGARRETVAINGTSVSLIVAGKQVRGPSEPSIQGEATKK